MDGYKQEQGRNTLSPKSYQSYQMVDHGRQHVLKIQQGQLGICACNQRLPNPQKWCIHGGEEARWQGHVFLLHKCHAVAAQLIDHQSTVGSCVGGADKWALTRQAHKCQKNVIRFMS